MISIRPALPWLLALLMLALISGCDRAPVSPATAAPASKDLPRTASTFTGAKKSLYDQVYRDHRVTFYCGCDYSADRKIDLASCGLTTLADKPRAQRIEAEHIFPAAQFGNFRACWRSPKDFPECVKSSGKTVSGRECCQRVDPVFESAHNDLMNLVPSVGEVNGKRSDFNWGMIPGEKRDYGRCNIEIDSSIRRAEPPENVMGDIARIMFYMADTYGFNLSRQDQQLYTAWSRQDPPDAWEVERTRRIQAIQGKGNRFVEDYAAIFGKTAAAPAKPPAPASSTPAAPAADEFSCGGKRRCGEMASCEEAKFYLTKCGVGSLDRDKDGVPCESLCR
ncbi:MAG: endonuclease [Candidatus Competibacteraceae bacterium]|nr:endonuclease [Candidatus Competibacteraceae bacterium]